MIEKELCFYEHFFDFDHLQLGNLVEGITSLLNFSSGVRNRICVCISSSYSCVMGAWQDNFWTLSCRRSMVLIDFLESFAWECSFVLKSTFSFSRHSARSVVILSSRASIATMSFKDFRLAFTFRYSSSNFVRSAYKQSRLA